MNKKRIKIYPKIWFGTDTGVMINGKIKFYDTFTANAIKSIEGIK